MERRELESLEVSQTAKRNKRMRVIGYLESSFWTMRGAEFGSMMRIAYSHSGELDSVLSKAEFQKPETMLAKKGEKMNGTRYVEMRGNVAVVDVNGVIAKRMDMFEEMCFGGTSTEKLLKDIQTCLDSPDVSSIVLNIDSPGGEAFGINELSQAIYAGRQKKPIKAYVSGLGCSGAYWIATAADEVIVDKSGFLGSIGVVTAWMDDSGFYQAMGIRKEVVTSSNAPLKRLNFDNEEHRAELQRELDSIESVFIKAVARNRGVTVDQVKQDFNQGGVLAGADAVKAGMADRTGSLEEVIKELSNKRSKTAVASASAQGDIDMTFKEEFKAFAVKHGLMANDETEIKDEPETTEAESVPEAVPEATPVVEEPAPAEDAPAPAASADTLKLEALQAKMAERVTVDASAFVESEIKAGRLLPNEKAAVESLYIQAAADDESSPLATGSRVESLKAAQSARVPNTLMKEVVDAEANQVLLAASGDRTDEEKRNDLLSKSPLGRSALKVIEGGRSATATAK
jgi:signal peptide peptidase SppA